MSVPDKDTLNRLYILEGHTTPEIAAMFDVCNTTVCNWLRFYGIPRRQRREAQRPAEPSCELLFELYVTQELSIDKIGRICHSSEQSVSSLLDQCAIPKRTKTQKMAGWNKGLPLPLEQRQRLSEQHKQMTGEKSPRYGAKLTDETKAKIANSLKGRYRKHLNPNWKEGGISIYRQYLEGQYEYKDWRLAVFTRDHFTCQLCGKPSNGDLQAHHVHPVNGCPGRILDILNGITLCERCHDKVRNHEAEYIEQFEAIIRQATPQTLLPAPLSAQ